MLSGSLNLMIFSFATQRDQIFRSTAFSCGLASLVQHLAQIRSARLIDIRTHAIDIS